VAQLLLERLVAAGQRLVTDAEVLQEILHRYAAIGKREAIGPAARALALFRLFAMVIESTDCKPDSRHATS